MPQTSVHLLDSSIVSAVVEPEIPSFTIRNVFGLNLAPTKGTRTCLLDLFHFFYWYMPHNYAISQVMHAVRHSAN